MVTPLCPGREDVLRCALELQTNLKIWKERANLYYERKLCREAYLHYSGKVLDRPGLTEAEKASKENLKKDFRSLRVDHCIVAEDAQV